ncbi:MAG: hypothetical protein ACU85U_15100 [Gammaproteobacteria bacterium]|jgi:hypothetical protein
MAKTNASTPAPRKKRFFFTRRVPGVFARHASAFALILAILPGAGVPSARAEVSGDIVTYTSPNEIEEQCIILKRMPGGVYTDTDRTEEEAFCAINFYAGDHALWPKVFSTSPATLVYDISQGDFAGRPSAFESAQCAARGHVKRGALGEPIAFKMTMNEQQTSATFATASLLDYHFSRYFDMATHVPVSVYRSMDAKTHHDRGEVYGVLLQPQGDRYGPE